MTKHDLRSEMSAALARVEAVMSIVRPRSNTREYLEALDEVRAVLAKESAEQRA